MLLLLRPQLKQVREKKGTGSVCESPLQDSSFCIQTLSQMKTSECAHMIKNAAWRVPWNNIIAASSKETNIVIVSFIFAHFVPIFKNATNLETVIVSGWLLILHEEVERYTSVNWVKRFLLQPNKQNNNIVCFFFVFWQEPSEDAHLSRVQPITLFYTFTKLSNRFDRLFIHNNLYGSYCRSQDSCSCYIGQKFLCAYM